MLNWIVIGIGDITTRRVIPAIQAEPRSQLYGLVTRDRAKATQFGAKAWTSLDEALSDPAVQAVYVGTPVFLHAPQTIQALRAGKHVLCEKPMAMNEGQARRMVDAAAESGKLFGVAYYRRFYPKVVRAKQLLEAGAIGKPVFAELTNHMWFDGSGNRGWLFDPAKSGGGPLFDVASHRIDVLNFLFGKPLRVSGELSNVVHHYAVEDNATVMIEYENGVRGIVDVRWHSKTNRDECRIRGTEGEMEMSPLNGPDLIYPGGHESLPVHPNLHFPLIENFVDAVEGKAPLRSSGATAFVTDWITEQARRFAPLAVRSKIMTTPTAEPETGTSPAPESRPSNFLRERIAEDLKTNKYSGRVQTRFPPEPNGYLHIGHAKAICIDFGLADEFGGRTNLRFDDTNPEKEDVEYVESIKQDIRWLGFHWDGLFYASDYFEQLYQWAIKLIKDGKAYVDDLTAEQIRQHRGTLTEPGKESPYRNRSVEENLDLFERMRKGEFPDGSRVLRAKIDMASPNFNMRDPVMYRILHAEHHRTGNQWPIYPMYDYAHGQSDSLEKVTHSMCSLEFADHQPLYQWFIEQLGIFPSQQIEFDRLSLTYTLMSKRKLRQLVEQGTVRGWDDPRMPTLSGLRRRGYTPEAIRNFVAAVGVSRTNGIVELAMLEHFLREDLNKRAARVMAVLRPLKVVIDNYPENQSEEMDAQNNPEDASAGSRKVPFSRELYIEQDDFREVPPPKYFRLSPGKEVRLRYGYFITAKSVVKNDAEEVVEVHCTYDPATRGGNAPDGRKVKSTIHWVSAKHAVAAEVRVYENLFTKENLADLEEGKDPLDYLNANSLEVIPHAQLEPSLANAKPGSRFQFERLGYFCADLDSQPGVPVFNRTVALKDTWAKLEKKQGGKG